MKLSQKNILTKLVSALSVLSLLTPSASVLATDYSSAGFSIEDPVLSNSGGHGTSTNYMLDGTIPDVSPSLAVSSNFEIASGFEAYSDISAPILSGNGILSGVSLTWTAAEGYSPVTYEAGVGRTVGGPYIFNSPQTTLSATITGLLSSVTYYAIIRMRDQVSDTIVGYSDVLAVMTLPDITVSGGSSWPGAPNSGSGASGTGTSTSTSSSTQIVIAPEPGTPTTPAFPSRNPVVSPTQGRDSSFDPEKNLLPGESISVAPPLLLQFGSVVKKGGQSSSTPASGVEVLVERKNSETNKFEPWPSKETGKVRTDGSGSFSFFVEPGTYRLRVNEPGFEAYTSPEQEVKKTGQLGNEIVLTPKTATTFPYTWPLVGLFGLMITILLFVFRASRVVPPQL